MGDTEQTATQQPAAIKRKRLPSALKIYEKYANGQYDPFNDYRSDLAFNLKNGSDILIEEEGIHIDNPFKFSLEDVANWSDSHQSDIQTMFKDYNEYFVATIEQLKNTVKPRYELHSEVDGYDRSVIDQQFADLTTDSKYSSIIDRCQKRINTLRIMGNSMSDTPEIDTRRQNIFNINFIKSNFTVDHPIQLLYADQFSLTNRVTVLQSVYENGTDKNPYSHNIRQYTIGEALELAANRNVNKIADKTIRPLILPNVTGDRITGNKIYAYWSGLQIFDLDLKFSRLFIDNPDMTAHDIRDTLYEKLKHYPWLVSIGLSASGRGIHMWTKVSRMHHIYKETDDNAEISKYWYRMSYIQKYAAVAYVLKNFCDIDDAYTNDRVLDSHAAKPAQGIAINYDPETKYNKNFTDLYPVLLYHTPPAPGIALDEWLTSDIVKNRFTNWFTENEMLNLEAEGIEIRPDFDMNITVSGDYTLNDVKQIDIGALESGERYRVRYRTANTVIGLYGDSIQSRKLCHHILQADQYKNAGQIDAFIRSAVMNKKTGDIYMIRQLQRLGLKIDIAQESLDQVAEQELTKAEYTLKHSNYIFRNTQPDHIIHLPTAASYLSTERHQVLSALDQYKVNIIESPPNTGKTTLFKELAKTATVCMVSPFTSTIESKIVTDNEINELFDVYYGDKSTESIRQKIGRSAVMTFDKFSRLNKEQYKMFDYIVVDESHLTFTSSYRLEVVSRTIENIREFITTEVRPHQQAFSSLRTQFQALFDQNDTVQETSNMPKLIMMTGTVTGEVDYFSHYNMLNYIKIVKQHPFKKELDLVFCKTRDTKLILMYEKIAESIKAGKKVLHPTNHGDGYAKKVVAAVELLIDRKIKWEYYKRANTDEEFLQKINTDCTTENIELLFCTDYLSVGIDITDKHPYQIVFNTDFTAEGMEQFNNRLRSTDIDASMFCDVLTEDGFIKPNTLATDQIQYTLTPELKSIFEDEGLVSKLQRHVHDKNGYHAIIGEMFSRYYYVSQTGKVSFIKAALEIEQFESQYNQIARGLLYIKTALSKKYGYTISMHSEKEKSEITIEKFNELSRAVDAEHKLNKSTRTVELINFLSEDYIYSIICERYKDIDYQRRDKPFDEDKLALHIGYDSTKNDGIPVFSYNREYKLLLDYCIKTARRLRRYYSARSVSAVLEHCFKGDLLNYTELDRYIKLTRLVNDDKYKRIVDTTKNILEIAYRHIEPIDGVIKIDRIDYDRLVVDIQQFVHGQIKTISEGSLQSERRLNEVNNKVSSFIDILFRKRVGKETVSIQFRKVYPFDSDEMLSRLQKDAVFNKVLLKQIDTEHLQEGELVSDEHMALTTPFADVLENPDQSIFSNEVSRQII